MSSPEALTHVRPRMGTLLAVSVPASSPRSQDPYVRTVFDIATRCEQIMSRHDADSDLSRLNRRAGRLTGLWSPELASIVRTARDLSHHLEGAFDPTVAPLIDLWQAAARRRTPPSHPALRQAFSRVGPEGLHIRGDRVVLIRPGMAIDLGGFGKGLALDRIALALRREGCTSGFLNFGESSLLAIGPPPGRRWHVVLRDPFGGFVGEFALSDRACSTSATLGQTVRRGRCVLGHIIDPRTGQPLTRPAQVTVVARSAAAAEAISTALLVLGRGAIDRIANRMKADVCWIDRSGIYTTAWFMLRPAA